MPALGAEVLARYLWAALNLRPPLPADVRPAVANLPSLGRTRLYLWTLTADRSRQGRPAGEHKIQLILPDQAADERGNLDLGEGAFTALLGFSLDAGVFVLWDAYLYEDFAFSANVQVSEDLLLEARDTGWAVATPRTLRRGDADEEEVRLACSPGNLLPALRAVHEADRLNVRGSARELFLLRQPRDVLGVVDAALEPAALRRRILAERYSRSATFSRKVRGAYGQACGICGMQLELIEGAHIIPVSEPGSEDALWNGIALCKNHHGMFDAGLIHVDATLRIIVSDQALAWLEEIHRGAGAPSVRTLRGKSLQQPSFWTSDQELREKMIEALNRRLKLHGVR